MTSSRLLIDERCVMVQPSLVRALGRMSDAALLQQLHYWMPHARAEHDGHRWVYKTAEQWSEETGLSTHQVYRAFTRLETLGLVVACKPDAKTWNHQKWYRIVYDHEVLSPAKPNSQNCETGAADSQDRTADPAIPFRKEESTTGDDYKREGSDHQQGVENVGEPQRWDPEIGAAGLAAARAERVAAAKRSLGAPESASG